MIPRRAIDRPIVIGVAGAHSTGKSTFLAQLASDLRRKGRRVSTTAGLGAEAEQIGFPILFDHTFSSTLWIITRGISNEVAAWSQTDVLLVDRVVPDALGYYLAALDYRDEQPDPTVVQHLREIVVGHTAHYDVIYRTVVDRSLPLGTNKNRDVDHRYRMLADRHIGAVLENLHIPYLPLLAHEHPVALRYAREYVNRQHKPSKRQNRHSINS